jgi:hypothetical protein
MIGKTGRIPAFRFLMSLIITIRYDKITITGYSNPQQQKSRSGSEKDSPGMAAAITSRIAKNKKQETANAVTTYKYSKNFI